MDPSEITHPYSSSTYTSTFIIFSIAVFVSIPRKENLTRSKAQIKLKNKFQNSCNGPDLFPFRLVCDRQVDISMKKNITINVHVNEYLKSLRQKVILFWGGQEGLKHQYFQINSLKLPSSR